MTATYRAHNLENHDRLVKPYPGIPGVVAELVERGARLGIVTSKNRTAAEQGLRHCAPGRFFDMLVTIGRRDRAQAAPGA